MLTLFASPNLPTSAGNADLCARLSVLKEAVLASAAELLYMAGESVDGPSTERCPSTATTTLTAICKLKNDASCARFSAAVKAVSVTDLSDF